jgi:hypothetical protein
VPERRRNTQSAYQKPPTHASQPRSAAARLAGRQLEGRLDQRVGGAGAAARHDNIWHRGQRPLAL